MKTFVPPDRLIPQTVAALLLFVSALAVAFAFLFPKLELRPMHTDEAVLAMKLGTLLEDGSWVYDKTDYHGPTLPYSALVASKFSGKDEVTALSKRSLRAVPAVYALALILLLPLVGDGVGGRVPVGIAALLTAVSPIVIYYGRYFIMEVPFAVFTFAMIACAWRYFVDRHVGWALAAGVCAGLTHATKETCIITFAATAGAVIATGAMDFFVRGAGFGVINRQRKQRLRLSHFAWAAGAAAVVSAVLYSSFFSNWRGVIDSYTTYASYLNRSEGSGHAQPWHYYLSLLTWRSGSGVVWSSAAVLALAAVGAFSAFLSEPERNQSLQLLRFLAFYAGAMFAAYSFIPYKTPWSILSCYQAAVVLAGYGAWRLIEPLRSKTAVAVAFALITAAAAHLALQSYRAAFRFPADVRNPFVYAHTSPNFEKLVRQLETYEQLNGDQPLHIEVAHPEFAWPLQWYLRDHPSTAYRDRWVDAAAAGDIVLVDWSTPGGAIEVLAESHQVDGPYGLRASSNVILLVRNDLWDKLLESRSQ